MKILCFGDSNTFGFNPIDGSRYPANIRWSGILKEELNTKAKIVEAGCNNRTCVANNPAGELFCGTKIFPKILNQDFSHIIIGLGINDLQKIYDIKPNDLENGLEELIQTAKEKIPSVEIILLSPNEITENILNSNFNVLFDESSIKKSKSIFKIYENLFNVVKLESNIQKDKYVYKGKTYNTLREIEKEFNLTKGLLYHRINKMNLTLEEAIERPTAKVGRGASKRKKETKEKFNYDGELFTLDELVDLSGLRKDTLYRRLKRGWSVKDAIEKPAQAVGRGGVKHE